MEKDISDWNAVHQRYNKTRPTFDCNRQVKYLENQKKQLKVMADTGFAKLPFHFEVRTIFARSLPHSLIWTRVYKLLSYC